MHKIVKRYLYKQICELNITNKALFEKAKELINTEEGREYNEYRCNIYKQNQENRLTEVRNIIKDLKII